MGPLTGLVYADAIGFLRDTHGLGHTYFAARNFLNFLNGGLPNLVALQAITVAFILWALRGNARTGLHSRYPSDDVYQSE